MNSSDEISDIESPQEQESGEGESRKSFRWGWLIIAMGMYALVILSPKLAQQEILLADYQSIQQQMLADQARLDRLQRVKHSIRSEPELVQKILNGQKSIVQGDREILPVAVTHSDSPAQLSEANSQVSRVRPHWYAPVVIFVGENETVRVMIMCGVIVLILMAFVSAQPPESQRKMIEDDPEEQERLPRTPNFLSRLKQRYGTESEEEIDEDLDQQLLELAILEDEWEMDALPIDDDDETEEATDLRGV